MAAGASEIKGGERMSVLFVDGTIVCFLILQFPIIQQLLMKNKMCRKCPRLLDSLYDILESAKKDKGNTHTASMEDTAGAFIMTETRKEESYAEKTQTRMCGAWMSQPYRW